MHIDMRERAPLLPVRLKFATESPLVDCYAHEVIAGKKWRNQGPFCALITTVVGMTVMAVVAAYVMVAASKSSASSGRSGTQVVGHSFVQQGTQLLPEVAVNSGRPPREEDKNTT